jgi:hypothetical protein
MFVEQFNEEMFLAQEKFMENFNRKTSHRKSQIKKEPKQIDIDNWID